MKSVRNQSYSGTYFPTFGETTTPALQFSPYLVRVRQNRDQNSFEYGRFYAVLICYFFLLLAVIRSFFFNFVPIFHETRTPALQLGTKSHCKDW